MPAPKYVLQQIFIALMFLTVPKGEPNSAIDWEKNTEGGLLDHSND